MLALRLFWEFFKTGLFSVGGGLATLPFLYSMSAKTGWFTTSDIANMVAVSESTPGPLGVNMATYVGVTTLGVFGGLVSTNGLILPSIIVILIIARVLQQFRESTAVQRIFYGLRPASCGLIANAGIAVAEISLLNVAAWQDSHAVPDLFRWKCILLAAAIYAFYKIVKPHPIAAIGISAVVGVVFSL